MTIDSTLQVLELAGLIRRTGDEQFSFRHTLMRDTAYSSLLREERRVLHRQVGQAMEGLGSGENGIPASVLAHHFLEGDHGEKALHYLREAGDEAARVYALTEALDHYGKALELVGKGFGSPDDLIYLYERRGRMLEHAGRYEQAVENYLELEQGGKADSDPDRELRGLLRRATLYSVPTAVMDGEQGRQLSEQALSMAREMDDQLMQSMAHWNLMRVCQFEFDAQGALDHGQRALDLLESQDSTVQRAFLLNDLVGIYLSTGHFDRALRTNAQAIDLWTEYDNLPMLVDAYCNQVSLGLFDGDIDSALEYSRRGLRISEKIGNIWGQSYSRYLVYWAHLERGDPAEAIKMARESIQLAEQAGFLVPQFQTWADLAFMHSSLGEFEQAHACLDRVLEKTGPIFSQWVVYPQAVRLIALTREGRLDEARAQLEEIDPSGRTTMIESFNYVSFLLGVIMPEYWLAVGDWPRVLAEAEDFMNSFDQFGMQFLKPDLHFYIGAAHYRGGDLPLAQSVLEDGLRMAETRVSRRTRWKLHRGLAAVAKNLGQDEDAASHSRASQADINYIADHTGSDSQRRAFLQYLAEWSLLGKRE